MSVWRTEASECVENEARDGFHFVEQNFIYFVAGLVVIFVYAVEKEGYRNVVFGEIVMVGTVIKAVRVVFVVVSIIEFQLGALGVFVFVYLVQFGRKLVGTDHVHVIFVVGMRFIQPADHVDVQVGNRVF